MKVNLSHLNLVLKFVGFLWCAITLIITWASDWALLTGKSELFGITVFNVKDSISLALLLFPGAFFLLIPYVLEKRFSIELTKKAAIKQYYTKLSVLLFGRYGKSDHYSYGQVKNTILEYKLNETYMLYAFAMYLSFDDYDKSVQINGKTVPAYAELRKEIGEEYFDGKNDFDALSMCNTSDVNNDGVDLNNSEGGSDSCSGDGGGGDG
jgi:hypothetical protein